MTTVDTPHPTDPEHQALLDQLEQVTAERDDLRTTLVAIHAISGLSADRTEEARS